MGAVATTITGTTVKPATRATGTMAPTINTGKATNTGKAGTAATNTGKAGTQATNTGKAGTQATSTGTEVMWEPERP